MILSCNEVVLKKKTIFAADSIKLFGIEKRLFSTLKG